MHSPPRLLGILVWMGLLAGGADVALCRADTKFVVGRRVPAEQRLALHAIKHDGWQKLLERYVDDEGQVDYAGWKRTEADVTASDAYLGHLSRADTATPARRADTLAFWINAYNALTIRGILREYPTRSIRDHAKKEGYNIWKDLRLIVGDEEYSLDAIEHNVLRKLGEPRIHFAIVCAARSCPRLRNEAYTAAKLEAQLAENAREFFASPRNFRYDAAPKRFHLSAILDWYAKDFGPTRSQQLRAIASYLPAAAQAAARSGEGQVVFFDYDWTLNDQALRRKPVAE
jgi:hypothetical protein